MQIDTRAAPGRRERLTGSRTVARVIHVLQAVTSGAAATVTEISRQTQIPYATSHRLVMALIDGGMLARDASRQITAGGRLIDAREVALAKSKGSANAS